MEYIGDGSHMPVHEATAILTLQVLQICGVTVMLYQRPPPGRALGPVTGYRALGALVSRPASYDSPRQMKRLNGKGESMIPMLYLC
jgi:hypothetical protein